MICGNSSSAREIRWAVLGQFTLSIYKLSWCHNFLGFIIRAKHCQKMFSSTCTPPLQKKKSLQVLVCTVVVWSNWIGLVPFSHFLWFSSLSDPHKCEKVGGGKLGCAGEKRNSCKRKRGMMKGCTSPSSQSFSRKSFMEQINSRIWFWHCITYQKIQEQKTALSTRVLRIQFKKKKNLRNLPLHCVKRGKGVRFSLVKNGSILNPKRGERRGERKKTKAIPQFSWKRRRMSIEQHTCAFLPLLLSVTHWMHIPTCKRKKSPCNCVASFPNFFSMAYSFCTSDMAHLGIYNFLKRLVSSLILN